MPRRSCCPTARFSSPAAEVSGGAASSSAELYSVNTIYDVSVSGMTSNGTVTASVTAGTVQDAAGNVMSMGSTSTDNTVTYDTIAPTVTINQAATQADPT